MRFVVYVHTNNVNGKAYVGWAKIGIGQTPHDAMMRRWAGHIQGARRGGLELFPCAIRKYGAEAFDHEVLDVLTTLNGVKRAESLWIAERKTFAFDDDGHGYNMTRGGDGSPGYRHTVEQRQAKSERQRGKKRGPMPQIAESKMGAKNGMFGKNHTLEHRQHMSEILSGRPSPLKGRSWSPARRAAQEAKKTS